MTRRGSTRAYEPSDEDRRKVEAMIGAVHLTLEEVAVVMGVSLTTVKEHFREEIARARANMKSQAGLKLFQIAMKDGHRDQFRALKFWLQTRARYSTTVNVQVEGSVEHTVESPMLADLRHLPLEQLQQLESIAAALDEQAALATERGRAGASFEAQGRPEGDPSRN